MIYWKYLLFHLPYTLRKRYELDITSLLTVLIVPVLLLLLRPDHATNLERKREGEGCLRFWSSTKGARGSYILLFSRIFNPYILGEGAILIHLHCELDNGVKVLSIKWFFTCIYRIKCSTSARHGKVMESSLGHGKLGTWYSKLSLDVQCFDSALMLGSNSIWLKMIKKGAIAMHNINSRSRENDWALNRPNPSRQRLCKQGWLFAM